MCICYNYCIDTNTKGKQNGKDTLLDTPGKVEEVPSDFIAQAANVGRGTTNDVSGGSGSCGIAFGIIELSEEEVQFFYANGVTVTSEEEVADGADAFEDDEDYA